jgi:hypothetical protein
VILVSASLSLFCYDRHPHLQDEVVYLYQARYLAEGKITAPAAPVAEAFSIYMIPYNAERWYSPFPPGWPAFLAIGVLLGAPWLVNPILAGANVILLFVLLHQLYSRRVALTGLLLFCLSPWQTFMAMSFMSHTLTLACALAGAVAMIRAGKTGRVGWGWVSGCLAGVVGLIRPLDGLAVAIVLGLVAVTTGSRRTRIYTSVVFGVALALVNAIALPYNKAITGQAMLSPLMDYYDRYFGPGTNAMGFGPGRGLGWAIDPFPGHSPLEAAINANLNAFSLNTELFGWSIGSLLIVSVFVFSGVMARRDQMMVGALVVIGGLYSLYWFSGGPDFGARYWYLMLVPLVALAARSVDYLESVVARTINGRSRKGLVRAAVVSLSFMALVNYSPWRTTDKYHNYLGMRPDIKHLAEEQGFGTSLVLIRGESHPDYESAWVYNPLDLSAAAPVYAWDRNPEVRARLLESYPDRPVWIVDGPSITGRGFKVVAGPLSARELTRR